MQRPSPRLVHLTWGAFDAAVETMALAIRRDLNPRRPLPGLYGQPRGGLPLAVALSHRLKLPLLEEPCEGMVWVDDIVDSGQTIKAIRHQFEPRICAAWIWTRAILTREDEYSLCVAAEAKERDAWYVFPWEDRHAAVADCEAYRRSRP